MRYRHISVMLSEVLEYLNPKPGQKFIDCTLGGGGYTFSIAKKVGERGQVIAIDADSTAIENANKQIEETKFKNILLINDNFRNLNKIIDENKEKFKNKDKNGYFDGIVFDLGLSSAQLEDRTRGFSFQLDAPLNMLFGRVNEKKRLTTDFIVNKYKIEQLIAILKEYGEERYAKRIAGAIVNTRRIAPVKSTGELVEIIRSAVPKKYQYSKIHFATRTFQALRIATNDEMDALEEVLPQAISLLKSGGRIAVVSFHSLEDRIVKRFFKKESTDCLCPPKFPICQCGHKAILKRITKRIIIATEEETEKNPRSRSAKLRVAEKI